MIQRHLEAGPEARQLRLPVEHDARRADDQRRPLERAHRLQGLAEAHVVGEHAAQAGAAQEGEPVDPLALVRAQRRREIARQRRLGETFEPCGERGEPIEAGRGRVLELDAQRGERGERMPRQAAVVLARGQQIGHEPAMFSQPA